MLTLEVTSRPTTRVTSRLLIRLHSHPVANVTQLQTALKVVHVLLSKMKAERKHLALVIDEYGGVDGLVTIEDLIEQVVGEIEDEHDIEEVELWKLEKPGHYVVQARAPLEEFEEEIGLRLSDDEMDDEIDTLGGLVFVLIGRVPARYEIVKHPSGAEFIILDADPRRIKRIRVIMP